MFYYASSFSNNLCDWSIDSNDDVSHMFKYSACPDKNKPNDNRACYNCITKKKYSRPSAYPSQSVFPTVSSSPSDSPSQSVVPTVSSSPSDSPSQSVSPSVIPSSSPSDSPSHTPSFQPSDFPSSS